MLRTTTTERRDINDVAAWHPKEWDTDGDGTLDMEEIRNAAVRVGRHSGMHSSLGWVGRTFTPSSSYEVPLSADGTRKKHGKYDAGRWGDPHNEWRPDTAATVLRLREACQATSRPSRQCPSDYGPEPLDWASSSLPQKFAAELAKLQPLSPRTAAPPQPMSARSARLMQPRARHAAQYLKEGIAYPMTARPSFREQPLGSIQARSRWFESSHPSWACAHTWYAAHRAPTHRAPTHRATTRAGHAHTHGTRHAQSPRRMEGACARGGHPAHRPTLYRPTAHAQLTCPAPASRPCPACSRAVVQGVRAHQACCRARRHSGSRERTPRGGARLRPAPIRTVSDEAGA